MYWQGILVISDLGLLGWLIYAGGTAATVNLALALFGVAILTFGTYVLHRRIERRIDHIGKL
jgi:hypothetical protein